MAETANIYLKLQQARCELTKAVTKKSGWNEYSHYHYFQLDDFMAQAKEILSKYHLFSFFNICPQEVDGSTGVVTMPERAVLEIVDADKPTDVIRWMTETADASMKGATPIQTLGSKHTYMRRYLWLEAMEIAVCDDVDAVGDDKRQVDKPKAKPQPRMATDEQVDMILDLYEDDRIKKIMQYYKVSKLVDLTEAQAVQVINKGKKEHEKADEHVVSN